MRGVLERLWEFVVLDVSACDGWETGREVDGRVTLVRRTIDYRPHTARVAENIERPLSARIRSVGVHVIKLGFPN